MTAGLIQRLVDENATRKLDQHDYRKKYDGYASRYAALESRMDSLEKERERKEIQYDIFSASFWDLARRRNGVSPNAFTAFSVSGNILLDKCIVLYGNL